MSRQDPFAKYGGQITKDPFAKYGGKKVVGIVEREKERRDAAARELQAERYPSSQELGTGGAGVEGSAWDRPFKLSDLLTVGKTALKDIFVAPVQMFGEIASPPGGSPFRESMRFNPAGRLAMGAYDMARRQSLASAEKAGAEGRAPIAAMIPVIGPMAESLGEESGVDPYKGAGHVAAVVAGPKILKSAVKAAPAAAHPLRAARSAWETAKAKAADVVTSAKGTSPQQSVFAALRPRNYVRNADKRVAGAMPEIARGAELRAQVVIDDITREAANAGKTPTPNQIKAAQESAQVKDIFSFGEALNAAIKDRMTQRRSLDAANPIVIEGRPIADAVINSVSKLERLQNPAKFQAIKDWAISTWDRKIQAADMVDMLEDMNATASVQGYYQKLPGQQIALNHRLDSAMANAQAGTARRLLMREFDKFSGTGTARGQVNMALRDLIATKDLFDRRYNVELRQAAQSLPQQVSKFIAAGKFGKAAKNLLGGNIVGAGLDALTGMSEVALGNFFRELNSSSGQIASAFRRFKDLPEPTVLKPVGRYGRALPPAGQRPTVQPRTLTGSATPGQPLESQGWNRPATIENPEVIPARSREGRIMKRGTPYSYTPRPSTRPARPGDKQLRDLLNVQEAEFEMVRDPKTGRFMKKIYKATGKVLRDIKEYNKKQGEKGVLLVKDFEKNNIGGKRIKPRNLYGMETPMFMDNNGEIIVLEQGFNHNLAINLALKRVKYDDIENFGDFNGSPNPGDLAANKLIRINEGGGIIAIEIRHQPSKAALKNIYDLLDKNSNTEIAFDLPKISGSGTAEEFLTALYKQFPSLKHVKVLEEDMPKGKKK